MNETVTETFGARLRRLRQERGLTIARLANESGVAVRTIIRAEHGQTMPFRANLRALASALGVGEKDLTEDAP